MPTGLSQTDKRLLVLTVGSLLVLAIATVLIAPPGQQEQSTIPSTYSSSSGGARAAYLLLQQLGFPVTRWEAPPSQLPAGNAILILAEPNVPPVPSEREALRRFVDSGGRVLFCGPALAAYFNGAGVASRPDPQWISSPASLPSPFTHSAPLISIRPAAQWTDRTARQLPLYGPPDDPDVVLWRLGKGEILWWSGASPLTNTGLTRSHNLALLLNAVSSRSIYWDEYFHGVRASLWSYVAATPVKWALLQFAFIFAAVIFSYSRRSGPIAFPVPPSRLSPLEFVDTLGGLYQRAGAYGVAIGVPYRQLRTSIEKRLQLPPETSDDLLAQAASERLGWDRAALSSALRAAARARSNKKVLASDALAVVQTLDQFTSNLEHH